MLDNNQTFNRAKRLVGPRPFPSTKNSRSNESATLSNQSATSLEPKPSNSKTTLGNQCRQFSGSTPIKVESQPIQQPQELPQLYYSYGYPPPMNAIPNSHTRRRPEFSPPVAPTSIPIPSSGYSSQLLNATHSVLYPPSPSCLHPPKNLPTPPKTGTLMHSEVYGEVGGEAYSEASTPENSSDELDEEIDQVLKDRFQAICISADSNQSSSMHPSHSDTNLSIHDNPKSSLEMSCSTQETQNTLQPIQRPRSRSRPRPHHHHHNHSGSSVIKDASPRRNSTHSDDSWTSDDYQSHHSTTISSERLSPRPTSILELRPKDFSPSKPNRNSCNPPLLNLPGPDTPLKRTMSAATQRASLTLVNEESALGMYRETAKKTNDPRIQLEFAKYLISSSTVFGDPNAKDGNPSLKKLLDEAIFWIKRLQKAGQPEAMYIFATWLEKGMYKFPQNLDKALSLYKSSSKYGFVKSTYKVGEFYERKKEYSRAVQFYLKAASRGDVSANYRLGTAYLHGEIKLKQHLNQAMLYLARSAKEANADCPDGAYLYGMILTGDFKAVDVSTLHHDLEMGQEYIEKAANLGHSPALYRLGTCYEFGELGYSVDPMKSIEYYREGAGRGNLECQMGLSGWYASGAEGILEQNDDLAYSWCFQAASKGLPKAEFALGYYYEIGVGVPIDPHTANNWYIKAAAHGSQDAQRRLANGVSATPLKRDIGTIRRKEKHDQGDCIIS